MQVPIYYTVCRIMWKTKRSKGVKDVWLISHHKTVSQIQANKLDWIKGHYFKNTKVKPDVLVQEIKSQKQIGTTSRPELREND